MSISAFTFVKNAVLYDYPIVESINSLLPLVDEYIVALGDSEDDTKNLLKSIKSPKLKLINTVWDVNLRKGGEVLAIETAKALNEVDQNADWAIYLQADEVIHEQDFEKIKATLNKWKNNSEVEGMVFKYKHFYGSYDYIANSRNWYRKEVRVIRPNQGIYPFKDAQGFQKNSRPLFVKEIDAHIYHYGWVKSPIHQQKKQVEFNKYWHNDQWIEKNINLSDEFDYSNVDSLELFQEKHPKVMLERIEKMDWDFQYDSSKTNLSLKNKFHRLAEQAFNIRIGEYRNYRILK